MIPRILVVEDDPIVAAVFESLLPAEEYAAEVVGSAEEGLQALAQAPFDLVISDIRLPGMDGIALLRRIKELQPELDVILMTAFAGMDTVLAALDAGVYDYLIKPFDDINEVLHKIRRALEKRRMLLENRQLIEYLRQANAQIEGMNRDLEAKVAARTRELELANERLEQLTLTDDVTGVHNQRYLRARLDEELERAERYGHGLAVVMMDVDNFKLVNDDHDHLFGSRVLRRVAGILEGGVRKIDRVIRYGGDEFVLLLPHTRLAQAVPIAERLRWRIADSDVGDAGDLYRVTASFGIAALGECEAKDGEGLLRAADEALYLAKAVGRNRVAVMHGRQPVAVVA